MICSNIWPWKRYSQYTLINNVPVERTDKKCILIWIITFILWMTFGLMTMLLYTNEGASTVNMVKVNPSPNYTLSDYIIAFVHIPKTGGSSFNVELANFFGQKNCIADDCCDSSVFTVGAVSKCVLDRYPFITYETGYDGYRDRLNTFSVTGNGGVKPLFIAFIRHPLSLLNSRLRHICRDIFWKYIGLASGDSSWETVKACYHLNHHFFFNVSHPSYGNTNHHYFFPDLQMSDVEDMFEAENYILCKLEAREQCMQILNRYFGFATKPVFTNKDSTNIFFSKFNLDSLPDQYRQDALFYDSMPDVQMKIQGNMII